MSEKDTVSFEDNIASTVSTIICLLEMIVLRTLPE